MSTWLDPTRSTWHTFQRQQAAKAITVRGSETLRSRDRELVAWSLSCPVGRLLSLAVTPGSNERTLITLTGAVSDDFIAIIKHTPETGPDREVGETTLARGWFF